MRLLSGNPRKDWPIRIAYYVITASISITSCASAVADEDSVSESEYRIGVGDVIQISVWQYEQFNATATVGPDGKITVPLLDDLKVAGLTREEVKKDITERLSRFIKEGAEVTVSVVQFNSQKIHIFGAVRNPRTITFSSPPPLLEVIMQSGFTPEADLATVKIIPADPSARKLVIVDISEVLRTGDTSQLPELHPGDTVYVPTIARSEGEPTAVQPPGVSEAGPSRQRPSTEAQREKFIVHVMGSQVNRPSSLEFDEEPTLTELLLRAGSVSDSAALKYVRIIRTGPAIGDRVVDVDMDEYLATGDESLLPKLYSGDIVYIPDITQEKVKDLSIIVTGQINNPGTYRVKGNLNILDVISLAGGLTADADAEMIRVMRESKDSYEEKVVNIEGFLSEVGSTSAPEMVGPGYRIYVPTKRRPVSSVAIAVRGLVTFLADLVVVYSFIRVID
jgi:polysaccharide export outer membrane protein